MRIGVVGGGVVGHAIARSYLEWCEVRVCDPVPERATHSFDDAVDSDLVFVCLPTPSVMPGEYKHQTQDCIDLSYLHECFQRVQDSDVALVLKCTVPIGTTRKLKELYKLQNIVHSPEFLTARCAVVDAQMPSRNIIGGEPCECRSKLATLYLERFPGVHLIQCTSDESEAIKLICNSFFATKVAFFNEANSLAEKAGLDWRVVVRGILADGRIAHAHTRVPGPSGSYGFGGNCLQKDLDCFSAALDRYSLPATVTKAASARNRGYDRQRS